MVGYRLGDGSHIFYMGNGWKSPFPSIGRAPKKEKDHQIFQSVIIFAKERASC